MVSTNDVCIAEVPAAAAAANAEQIKSISDEEFEKAQKTFQSGKKNLFLNKYDESVNNIADACEIYSAKYGEMDAKCAEVYFFYGRALLELARVESTVLGNALTGVPEENGSKFNDSRYGNPDDIPAEEKEDISEKVIDALCNEPETKETDEKMVEGEEAKKTEETTKTEDKKEEIKTEDKKEEAKTEDKKDEVKTEDKKEEKVVEKKEEEKVVEAKEEEVKVVEGEDKKSEEVVEKKEGEEEEEGSDEEESEDDEEDLTKNDEQVKDEAEADEISNLQRSWEMFELAKLVYTKHFDNDLPFKNKRIAECLMKLGEISIEQEIYEQAITDIAESVRMQEELKETRDERMLAESYYQLALAQQFNNLFEAANTAYQKSIDIVKFRVEKLNGKLEEMKDNKDADADLERKTINEEISELETLLPEMQSKLEEVNEAGQASLKAIKEAKDCFANKIATEGGATETPKCELGQAPTVDGEVKDITGMVKSKRKIEEVTAGESTTEIKKTRLSGANEDAAEKKTEEKKTEEKKEEKETTTEATKKVEEEKKEVVEKVEETKKVVEETKMDETPAAVVAPVVEAPAATA